MTFPQNVDCLSPVTRSCKPSLPPNPPLAQIARYRAKKDNNRHGINFWPMRDVVYTPQRGETHARFPPCIRHELVYASVAGVHRARFDSTRTLLPFPSTRTTTTIRSCDTRAHLFRVNSRQLSGDGSMEPERAQFEAGMCPRPKMRHSSGKGNSQFALIRIHPAG